MTLAGGKRDIQSIPEPVDSAWGIRIMTEDGIVREKRRIRSDSDPEHGPMSVESYHYRGITRQWLKWVCSREFPGAAARTTSYRISVAACQGEEFFIERGDRPIPIDGVERAEWEAFVSYLASHMPGRGPSPIPLVKPFIRGLMSDDAGRKRCAGAQRNGLGDFRRSRLCAARI
jgi:hypothetical protein